MKISAFLIVFNEEKHIERCLKSIDGVVDEIILIHDGECSDNSLKIAQKFNAKIYIREHRGMREFHQVFAIEQCGHEWILQIDADEFLSRSLRNNLSKLINNKDVDAYSFVWPIWDGDKYLTNEYPHKKILFRKKNMYYFSFPGKDPGTYGNLIESKLVLEHQPTYNNYTLEKFRNKWKKWINVHAKFFYNKNYEHYNCNTEILDKFYESIKKQKKYAYPFLAPTWMLQSILVSLIRHSYWKSIKTWKISFLQGLYGFYLCLYIWKYRK